MIVYLKVLPAKKNIEVKKNIYSTYFLIYNIKIFSNLLTLIFDYEIGSKNILADLIDSGVYDTYRHGFCCVVWYIYQN